MPVYTLSETSRLPTAPISEDMFGTNYVTIMGKTGLTDIYTAIDALSSGLR